MVLEAIYTRAEMGRAELVLQEKVIDQGGDITELTIWKVPVSARQPAGVKYRLAFIKKDAAAPAVLYDNHHPKGHHRHVEGREEPYDFIDVDKLSSDFQTEVRRIKGERG